MDIEQIRTLCMQLQGATESVKWDNNLVFSVGGKMFCITNLDGALMFSVKVAADDFEEQTSQPGIVPAPYLARAGWVQVTQPHLLSSIQLSRFIQQSYKLVVQTLTRKMKAELGLP